MRYSGFKVIKEALTGHKGWTPAWRDPAPQAHYDIIIIGGGGHGLATAHYLAKVFDQKRIAVIEKGWIGGGNVGRNTTIIRSNYLLDGNEPFYEFSLKLWEGKAVWPNVAAARCAMTRWLGAMHAALTSTGSISSRTARSPASRLSAANVWALRPPKASSERIKSAAPLRGLQVASCPKPACACPLKATCCKPSSPKG